MRQAFAQALAVKGRTLPNPAVGALVVKGGRVLGAGGTQPAGGPHAEIMAMRAAGARGPQALRGSTLYVTLEPCCHHGRTPPCTDAILASGIRRVVVSAVDPNPRVAGKGLAQLRSAGLEVVDGVLGDEGRAFYRHFAHHILHGRPRILVKIAQGADGTINAAPGKPTALTGRAAQVVNHRLRVEADAWLIGGATLRSDNPRLTPRLVEGPSPEALVLSRGGARRLHLPAPVLVSRTGRATQPNAWPALFLQRDRKVRLLAATRPRDLPHQVRFTRLPEGAMAGHAAMHRLVRFLLDDFKAQGYHLVVIEGGRGVWEPFLRTQCFDELWLFTSPQRNPQGERWAANLPPNWDKSLVFRSFTQLDDDTLTVFSRA